MERRHGPLRVLAYGVVGFLLAGCLLSGAVELAADGRGSEFTPWMVGFGGTLVFAVCAGQTARAARQIWRAWLLTLFGRDTWAVLTDKECHNDEDLTSFWKAHVEGPGFRQVVDTGVYDPGPVGEPVRVLWHAASDQVELVGQRPGPVGVVVRELLMLGALVVMTAFTAGIGYLLIWGGLRRLD